MKNKKMNKEINKYEYYEKANKKLRWRKKVLALNMVIRGDLLREVP